MRRRIYSLIVFTFCFIACDGSGDGCEEGYIVQYGPEGSNFCVEEFEEGIAKDYQSGDSYYHKKHGIITYIDNIWINRFDQTIVP